MPPEMGGPTLVLDFAEVALEWHGYVLGDYVLCSLDVFQFEWLWRAGMCVRVW